MDVTKELEKWKLEFRQAKTPEERENHQKRFRAFLGTLSEEEGRSFAQAFKDGRVTAIQNARELTRELTIKTQLESIQDIVSFSYIAKKYFGKSRHWFYQRINGNTVNGKPARFTPEEIRTLKAALDDICGKIQYTSRSFV
ncbi:MAG: DUF5053 domain-containing protein [Bacteroides sp.]|nr:DUF5053 domain-containing protein [Bacteroides sp.]